MRARPEAEGRGAESSERKTDMTFDTVTVYLGRQCEVGAEGEEEPLCAVCGMHKILQYIKRIAKT